MQATLSTELHLHTHTQTETQTQTLVLTTAQTHHLQPQDGKNTAFSSKFRKFRVKANVTCLLLMAPE